MDTETMIKELRQQMIDLHHEQQRQTLIMLDIAQLLRQIRHAYQMANSENVS